MPGDKDPAASEGSPAKETKPAEAEGGKAEGEKTTVEEKKEEKAEEKKEGGKVEEKEDEKTEEKKKEQSEKKEEKAEEKKEEKAEEKKEEKAEAKMEEGKVEEEKKEGEGEQHQEEEDVTPKMRSVVLTGYGGVKMLKVLQKPQPVPGEGQVLIRVNTCGLGFQDVMQRQGYTDTPVPRPPLIPGMECAGVVEELGPNTTGFNVGDRVIALTEQGAWAELVAVSALHVYRLPDSVTFRDGVCLLTHYVTAYVILFDMAGIRPGHSLLLHSAAGGVGQAILQLCGTVGDVTIYGTASYHKHDSIKGKVTHFFAHNVDYANEIRKLSRDGVDIVLDCLSGEDTNRGIALLKPMGKYILYGSSNLVSGETKGLFSLAKSWWQVDKVSPVRMFEENRTIGGFHLRHLLFRKGQDGYVRSVITKLLDLHAQGQIAPVVDSVWAFEDVGEAMQKLQDRQNIGKVLLDPTQEAIQKERADSKAAAAATAEVAEPVTESGDQGEQKTDQKAQTTDTPSPPAEADDAQ